MRTTPGCELCSSLRMCCRREGGMTAPHKASLLDGELVLAEKKRLELRHGANVGWPTILVYQ